MPGLILLHDERGHPLLATTHRGDTYLTAGMPQLIERYERSVGEGAVQWMVVDREGMTAAFLAELAKDGRTVVTILRGNQYQEASYFTEAGEFVPLAWNRHGGITREVAPVGCSLSLPDHPDKCLNLRVALVRNLRRRVPQAPEGGDDSRRECYPDSPSWFDANWVVTPALKIPTDPHSCPSSPRRRSSTQ